MIHYSSFVIVNTFCLFKGVWRGILYHVINEHEWLLLSSDGSFSCKHGPLSSDQDKGMLGFCIHNNKNNNTLFTKSNTAYRHITIFAKLIKNQYIPKIEIVVDFAEKSLFQYNFSRGNMWVTVSF
jgi:hypothetical protein